MKKLMALMLITLLPLLFVGCATTTITGVWTDESYKQTPIQSVMILGVADNQRNRKIFESVMAAEFEKNGVQAIASSTILGDAEIKEENVLEIAQEKQVQTVLVTRLVGSKQQQVYYPPTRHGVPHSYYRSWNSYYYRMYDYAYTPGYMATYTNVLLETNVFDVKGQTLIWSAASESLEPRNINKDLQRLAQVLVQKMRQSKLLK